ncbi:hypothetical protein JNUCC0626_48030 [Lentzea sp. JNUCC 0626]|uniref:hypothetical protein n=1 Tax=Lentzea sp. JNUCC 0626 TaxID=3367513 RepID=UPI003748C9EC
MAEYTRLDPDGARMENARLRDLGARFGDSTFRIQDAARAYGRCWGGDQFGAAFEQGYLPSSDKFLEQISVFSDNIKKTVEQIEQAIQQLENADKNNANNLG